MPEAIMLRDHGGPEALRAEKVAVPPPGPGELRLRQTAVGVNFHDCYVRSGLYRTLPLPGVPGIEAAGVVEAVGPGVTGFAPGDRVGYVTGGYGAYASHRVLPAALALRLPGWMDERLAASVLLKGLTAEMLLRQVHRVEAGQTILVHAAAGGVGRLLCQWAAHLGATVIGTAGSAAKAEAARAAGCAHVVLYREQDFVAEVKRITGGRGVDAAYDSVGKDTFDGSLDCLAPRGHLVNFGQASGPVPPFQVQRLAAKSNSLTRPIVFHYLAGRTALEAMAASLFAVLENGAVRAEPGATLPLAEAARAHHLLESRQAEAPLVLLPQEQA
ncbi:quinone oxidoreductase [Roseomonas eburnea]|uniref:Quinone oxidoreductase n=1 Tax=Neoroseomonas eburnea TaxID=1346889 RepID=A0A9X9X663_9PROT|nr:quinone oxidoreductase [Neoroseomonas eburnea]MBR0679199.1 quinone oxidoreductase [Neoroseomonas eburnea]